MSRSVDIKLHQRDILFPHVLATLKPDLKLSNTAPSEKILAITISHSCDIASNGDSTVEFIAGIIVDEIHGNYAQAKNPRKLHLQHTFEGNPIILELVANQKFELRKEELENYDPDNRYALDSDQKKILQAWLAARYKRQALPDALQDRLVPILEFLEKQGKRNTADILGYFVQYDPDEELSNEHAYDFSVYIVYSVDKPQFEEQAIALTTQIREKFSSLIKKTAHLGLVKLLECKAFSEMEFTLKDLREKIEYRFDYLSYKKNPHDPTI